MTTDVSRETPVRAGDVLRAKTERVASFAAEHPRPALHPLVLPDTEDLVGLDPQVQLTEQWMRVIPERFHDAQLADLQDDPELAPFHADLLGWATEPGPSNLVLFGPTGTGKSHAAVAAVRPAHYRHLDVRFVPVVELLDMLRPPAPADVLYELADVDRLVIDDLGAQKDTDWSAERLYALVNRRWLEKRPTVFTLNLTDAEMADPAVLDPRLFSRVRHGALGLAFGGPDRRASA